MCIRDRCKSPLEPQKVSKQCVSQAKAILGYIRKVPSILDEMVCFPSGSFQTLKNALKIFSTNKCWFPIRATPPDDYNKYLPWKGSACTSHLTSLTRSVLLCSHEDFDTLSYLTGSQMYIIECPSILRKALCTSNVPIKAVLDQFKLIIKTQREFDTSHLDEQVHQVYDFLQDNLCTLQRIYSTNELCCQIFCG